MTKYKELYLELKEQKDNYEKEQNTPESTGLACPVCLELTDEEHELEWYPYGELVCTNEECTFDKTLQDILNDYYNYKAIGHLTTK